jgi:hypothetical protein
MAVTRTPKPLELEVIDLERGNTDLYIVGTSPFYCNRMGAKAQRELLLPRGTLTRAQKATQAETRAVGRVSRLALHEKNNS